MLQYIKAAHDAKFASKDEGATAVEYGLLVAGIGAVVAVGIWALGGAVNDLFGEVTTGLNDGFTATTP